MNDLAIFSVSALVLVIVLFAMFDSTNMLHVLTEKYVIKKTKDKFEVLNTKKWSKIEKKRNPHELTFFNTINFEIAYWYKEGRFGEKDRERLNKRIKELNFIMEQFRGGEKEYEVLKKEVSSLSRDLEQGMYFEEYQKNIKEKIKEIKETIDFSNIEEKDIYEVNFSGLSHVLGYIEGNFTHKMNSLVIKKAKELDVIRSEITIGEENRKEVERLEVLFMKLLDTKIEEWEKDKNKEDNEIARKIEERMKKVIEE